MWACLIALSGLFIKEEEEKGGGRGGEERRRSKRKEGSRKKEEEKEERERHKLGGDLLRRVWKELEEKWEVDTIKVHCIQVWSLQRVNNNKIYL